MQITITNGTLSTITEKLTPAEGYIKPVSVTVTGATDNYTRSTGLLVLINPQASVSVTAAAIKATVVVDMDDLDLAPGDYTITVKAVGTGYADSDASNAVSYTVYDIEQVDNTLVIKSAPSVSQSGGVLTIT